MIALAASPHLVDLVLLFTLAEAVWLVRRRTGWNRKSQAARRTRANPVIEVFLLLLPGVCLMLAVRTALAGAGWPWIALLLMAAFVAHAADLRHRWRGE